MLSRLKSIVAVATFLALAGCGGTGVGSNPAHVRFLNAFASTGDVRVYVGGSLLNSNGVGPFYTYGGGFGYAKAPSGAVAINVNPYIDPSTVYATLASQTLVKDRNYTVIGVTSGTTRSLRIYTDGVSNASAGSAYYRLIDASTSHAALYATLTDPNGNVVYQTSTSGGLTLGGTTNYRAESLEGSASYTLRVYDTTDTTTVPLSTANVTLTEGTPVTMVLYDTLNNTTNISVKAVYDVYTGS